MTFIKAIITVLFFLEKGVGDGEKVFCYFDHKFHRYIWVNKDKLDNKKIWSGFPSGGKPLGRVFWEARPAWGFPGRDTWPGKPLGEGRRGKEVGLWGAVLPPPSNNAGASHQLRSTPRHYRKQNSFCGRSSLCGRRLQPHQHQAGRGRHSPVWLSSGSWGLYLALGG